MVGRCALGGLVMALTATPLVAQQPQPQPDPALLQRIITSLQQQRNDAMDKAALADARAAQLAEELQRLKAEQDKAKPKEEKPKE